jgi:hypothetical protein
MFVLSNAMNFTHFFDDKIWFLCYTDFTRQAAEEKRENAQN